jgi:murein DD-endopeptidase MepM/ murein hydrolase activator NlpD
MNEPPLVELGDIVSACQKVGEVGTSGNSFEPHLHLETRLGPAGRSFTSMGYYKADNTEEERANYVAWRTGGEFLHFDPISVLYFNITQP